MSVNQKDYWSEQPLSRQACYGAPDENKMNDFRPEAREKKKDVLTAAQARQIESNGEMERWRMERERKGHRSQFSAMSIVPPIPAVAPWSIGLQCNGGHSKVL